jgi:hypothetical protein
MGLRNLNPLTDADIPDSITRDTETAEAIANHKKELFPHTPVGIEFAPTDLANPDPNHVNYIDFHSNLTTYRDFDARIIVRGGGPSNGLAIMLFQCAELILAGKFRLQTTGTPAERLLSIAATIDPPLIAAGGLWSTTVSLATAAVGDFCAVSAPAAIWANANPLIINAAVTAAGVITVWIRNISSAAIDLSAFALRILVIGF